MTETDKGKKGPCACGKKILKRDIDFIADVDELTMHRRGWCRPLRRDDIFGARKD